MFGVANKAVVDEEAKRYRASPLPFDSTPNISAVQPTARQGGRLSFSFTSPANNTSIRPTSAFTTTIGGNSAMVNPTPSRTSVPVLCVPLQGEVPSRTNGQPLVGYLTTMSMEQLMSMQRSTTPKEDQMTISSSDASSNSVTSSSVTCQPVSCQTFASQLVTLAATAATRAPSPTETSLNHPVTPLRLLTHAAEAATSPANPPIRQQLTMSE